MNIEEVFRQLSLLDADFVKLNVDTLELSEENSVTVYLKPQLWPDYINEVVLNCDPESQLGKYICSKIPCQIGKYTCSYEYLGQLADLLIGCRVDEISLIGLPGVHDDVLIDCTITDEDITPGAYFHSTNIIDSYIDTSKVVCLYTQRYVPIEDYPSIRLLITSNTKLLLQKNLLNRVELIIDSYGVITHNPHNYPDLGKASSRFELLKLYYYTYFASKSAKRAQG